MTILVIGDRADTHVAAVLDAVSDRCATEVLVLDAPSLQRDGFSLTIDRLEHLAQTVAIDAPSDGGWLRRYAPTVWGRGSAVGSLDAVTKGAFVALVGSITRMGSRRWLTRIENMLSAEDRIVQLEVANSLGIRIPDSIVTSSPDEAVDRFSGSFLVKPISGGYYWEHGRPKAVYASELTPDAAAQVDFSAAPFVAQEIVPAILHYRVVTVGDRAWSASLGAEGRPLDWREEPAAHSSWYASENEDVCRQALELANAFDIGYSSQDWIFDGDELTFLDLNPGGQWLFLPEPIHMSISGAIACFLCGVAP